MRNAFVKTLVELAEQDERILLLTSDLGYMALEPFVEKFPKRFFNVGIAEQNMIGLATGLAEAGFRPFAYSIVPFAVLRPYEFIRNGPIAHRLPVRIVGMGGGFSYSHDGISHYGHDDIGVLRVQPGITIVVPADHEQARSALLTTSDLPGPVYYRLSKGNQTIIPELNGHFELGRAQCIGSGKDVMIVAMGTIAGEAHKALEDLVKQGISAGMAVVASISPPPVDDLRERLSHCRLAATVEDHYITGGLGSMVSEIIAESGLQCPLVRFGIQEQMDGFVGSQRYLYDRYGVSSRMIANRVLHALQEIGECEGSI
jgi:transketolase